MFVWMNLFQQQKSVIEEANLQQQQVLFHATANASRLLRQSSIQIAVLLPIGYLLFLAFKVMRLVFPLR
ncbi:RAB6-interacting golgin [Frankliniella fusca]|uniref:RAB6-interacting golgin n=1 Tax=Frankliniella fusca TaxID=407009 RepID=A0AAE1GV90_9NEOP|nr:RAB6-interacting golgin [Frankliniella fusca]KAK3921640.1 RAB6-interacting golgin [Frankliniella fusca]